MAVLVFAYKPPQPPQQTFSKPQQTLQQPSMEASANLTQPSKDTRSFALRVIKAYYAFNLIIRRRKKPRRRAGEKKGQEKRRKRSVKSTLRSLGGVLFEVSNSLCNVLYANVMSLLRNSTE